MPTETIERLCDETKVEAERAYIADMRRHADVLDLKGEGVSAARWRRAADYAERVLNEQCRDENDLPESDGLPSNHPDGEQLDSYLAPRPSGTPSVFTETDYAEESLFDAPIYKSSEWFARELCL